MNPLDGAQVMKEDNLKNVGVMTQYYMSVISNYNVLFDNFFDKVVPTTYQDLSGKSLYVHQFAVNSNSLETVNVPAAYFR